MHVFKLFYLIVAFCLITPQAHAEIVPDALQGLWATPQCLTPKKFAYHSKTHVLYFTKDFAVTDVSTIRIVRPEYYVIENGRDVYPIQIFEKGYMDVGIMPEGRAMDDRLRWEDLPLKDVRRYHACENTLPEPHDFAPMAFAGLDVLEGFCRLGSHETCLRAMFAFADADASQTVSLDEATKIGLMALYLNPLLGYMPIGNETFYNRLRYASQTTPMFMQDVFKIADRNGSGDLDYGELDYVGPLFTPELKKYFEYDAIIKIMSKYPKLTEPSLR